MSWRPDGWRKPVLVTSGLRSGKMQSFIDQFYEAGADAMLEALKERGTVLYLPANIAFTSIPIIQPVSGAWVFIPDEVPSESPNAEQ